MKNALFALTVIILIITGLTIATTYSTSSFEGTGWFSASNTATGLSSDYGGIGDFTYRAENTQDGAYNETANVLFTMDTADGADKFTHAHVSAKDANGPSSSVVWASRSDYITISALSNVSDNALSTQVDLQGNMDLWVVGKTFDKNWKASDAEVYTVRNGTDLTVSLYRSAVWSLEYVDPDWLCTDCEDTTGEVKQPVSYAATGVAYAGKGVAYAARNVNSTGLQGNGSTA